MTTTSGPMGDSKRDRLDERTSFARGFLLASHWAGLPPGGNVTSRIPALEGQETEKEYEAVSLLPPDRRSALGSVWLGMERRSRIDEALDVHWTWLAEELKDEPLTLVLQFLGTVRPDLARDTVRALWATVRSAKTDDMEIERPSPVMAAHLRRHFFSRFALVAEREREGAVGALLLLSRRGLYQVVQDAGLQEISRIGGQDKSRELLRLLKGYRGVESARISKMLDEEGKGGADGAEDALPGRNRAVELVGRAVEATGGEGDLVGLVGIGKLAIALSCEPARFVRMLACRMSRPVGTLLIEWAARFTGEEREDREEVANEIMERMGTILSRESSPALARGDS